MTFASRLTALGSLTLAAGALAVAACSVTSTTVNPLADGGGNPLPDGGGGGDVTPGTDGGGGNDTGGPVDNFVGNVNLAQTTSSATFSYTAGASLGTFAAPSGGGATCATTTAGACTTLVCPTSDGGAPPAFTTANAGDITITGQGTSLATLTFDATKNAYKPASGATQFFAPGDTITLAAAGATFAAFGPQTALAPSDLVLTSPSCGNPTCPDIDRTVDMTVAWTSGGAGDVEVVIETIAPAQVAVVSCKINAGAGQLVIPVAALGKLDLANGTTIQGVEVLSPVTETKFTASGHEIKFRVAATGAAGSVKMSK